MYEWIDLKNQNDIEKIKDHVSSEYDPAEVSDRLQSGLSKAVKGILVEKFYIDKDYRSTYYNFYAKKGQSYRSDCVRLHFFGEGVKFRKQDLTLSCSDDNLNDFYFGYMTLRPTGVASIGRSVLCSTVRCDIDGVILKSAHKIHLLGNELLVKGIPSMDQHKDISVCAHSACWSILRHYSQRYSIYREFLTHEITLMAQEFDPGGLVPSKGLTISHVERVFQAAGTFPLLITRQSGKDAEFYRQLHAYVESGFPVFAAMHGRAHAVAVVGYKWKEKCAAKDGQVSYSWNEVESLIVVDDNHLPYLPISAHDKNPSPPSKEKYSAIDIDSFIVPMPEKIFYPAEVIDRTVAALYELKKIIELPPQDEIILRYFITTGAGLRNFVKERPSEFDPKLYKTIMELPLAQFVWIVELATKEDWKKGQISARAVFDATASEYEDMPLWLFHNRKTAMYFTRKIVNDFCGVKAFNFNGTERALTRMEKNLETVARA